MLQRWNPGPHGCKASTFRIEPPTPTPPLKSSPLFESRSFLNGPYQAHLAESLSHLIVLETGGSGQQRGGFLVDAFISRKSCSYPVFPGIGVWVIVPFLCTSYRSGSQVRCSKTMTMPLRFLGLHFHRSSLVLDLQGKEALLNLASELALWSICLFSPL